MADTGWLYSYAVIFLLKATTRLSMHACTLHELHHSNLLISNLHTKSAEKAIFLQTIAARIVVCAEGGT